VAHAIAEQSQTALNEKDPDKGSSKSDKNCGSQRSLEEVVLKEGAHFV
jgi:hypothetical protein